jgi:hypothetical protein
MAEGKIALGQTPAPVPCSVPNAGSSAAIAARRKETYVDHDRFDGLTRSLGAAASRRGLGRALAGGGLGALLGSALGVLDADAANKKRRKKKRKKNTQQRCTPNCIERTCGNDGCGSSCGACGTNQICRGGNCCVPEPLVNTCTGRCGTRINNCGQPVTCGTCPLGQDCLGSGGCAIVCTNNLDCPAGSGCGCSDPSVEGTRHCISDFVRPLVSCTSTTDCPLGAHCQDTSLGRVCVSVCQK